MNRYGYEMIKSLYFIALTRVDKNDINKTKYKTICTNCKRVLSDLITLEQLEKHLDLTDKKNKTEVKHKKIKDKKKKITFKTTKNEFENLLSEVLNELETPKEETTNA